MLEELERQIIALYSKGMSTRYIEEILSKMYGFDISPSLISKITDRILPRIEEWLNRPLKRMDSPPKIFQTALDLVDYQTHIF